MAIQKTKVMANGHSGNYWRMLSIHLDRQSLKAVGRIALFKDKETSDAGGQPMGCIKDFRFSFTMLEFLSAPNAIAFTYTKIRTKAETLITHDLNGTPLEVPRFYDPDLAGGETV